MAAVTAIIAYPNKYTRMNASELIYLLFTQCGVTNEMDICDYVNRNFTNANHAVPIAEAGPGVYTALWQLTLALMFKFVITIFTFGIKVWQCVILALNLTSLSRPQLACSSPPWQWGQL